MYDGGHIDCRAICPNDPQAPQGEQQPPWECTLTDAGEGIVECHYCEDAGVIEVAEGGATEEGTD
jgi:hypothetical protein